MSEKRGRGRPKGSKNKPKVKEVVADVVNVENAVVNDEGKDSQG